MNSDFLLGWPHKDKESILTKTIEKGNHPEEHTLLFLTLFSRIPPPCLSIQWTCLVLVVPLGNEERLGIKPYYYY